MKPSHLTNLLALFVVLALAAVSVAGVPQTINYQGYLTTTDGVPVTDVKITGPTGRGSSLAFRVFT